MTKVIILLILFVGIHPIYAQKSANSDVSFNECEGAVNIFENGDFHLEFIGKKANEKVLENYSSLSNFNTENIIWVSYIAPENGDLIFRATSPEDYLQMIIFEEGRNPICEQIQNGTAEIQRLHLGKDNKTIGLDYKVDSGIMYALKLKEGQHIMIAFATESDTKNDMMLQWQFVSSDVMEEETKVVDRRMDDFATTLSFEVFDKETNRPIISSLSIEGSKDIDGLYVGSEFYFNIERSKDLAIKVDAEGYFFHDSVYEVNAMEDIKIRIVLDRISSGKSMTIQEIEFVPGSSEITQSSIPNLRRLKDFLALNSDLNVEIQGHVFALGDNTFAAQRVSEARAKRVMKYLIENGIDKDRLTAVGFGNTKPVYAEPKFFYEEQANRRVEVMVK